MSKIKTVGIIGTGVIGTGWIIRNLAHNKIVHAYDQNKNLKSYVLKEIKRTSKSIKKIFGKKTLFCLLNVLQGVLAIHGFWGK